MIKNEVGQYIAIFAYDTANSQPKTGDAGNITAYYVKDGGSPAQTNDVNPTELDSVNMPGIYQFALTQAETNCDQLLLVAKSSSSNVDITPVQVFTIDESRLEWLYNMQEGDVTIDTSNSPWEMVVKKKDTETELLRKKLYQYNGDPVASTSDIIAKHLQSAPGG